MLLTKRADLISAAGNYRLVKLDFAVAGVKKSPKAYSDVKKIFGL
ncbi:MAG: hypothetical protein Q4B34_02055 [Candidatus Saccharibacteria bacterium]|nr:hypothetical protein [Candidatus Saccharibacteria bacterium]